MLLRREFRALGMVNLNFVSIGGALECDGSWFDNGPTKERPQAGKSLSAQSASIAGSVLLRRQFHSVGQVDLYNVHIGRDLDCQGGTFENAARRWA